MLIMALAGLLHPDLLYNMSKRIWIEVARDKLPKILAGCEIHYSFILNKILRDIVSS